MAPGPRRGQAGAHHGRGKARAKLKAAIASLGQTLRAWELKGSFRRFWSDRSPAWAQAYLKAWATRAM